MQIRKLGNLWVWYSKHPNFILAYVTLCLFQFLLFSTLVYYFTIHGLNHGTSVLIILDIVFIVLLVITPFRFKHFQKEKNIGQQQGIFPIQDNKNENFSNFQDYERKLSSFFILSNENGEQILDSIYVNDHAKRIMILILFTIVFDIIIFISLLFMNFVTGPSISLLGSIIVLSYASYRSYPQRETNYKLKIASDILYISLKLSNV